MGGTGALPGLRVPLGGVPSSLACNGAHPSTPRSPSPGPPAAKFANTVVKPRVRQMDESMTLAPEVKQGLFENGVRVAAHAGWAWGTVTTH